MARMPNCLAVGSKEYAVKHDDLFSFGFAAYCILLTHDVAAIGLHQEREP